MTEIGSSTPTYDANGNVTNDFLHTYAWDAAGRPVTVDSVALTYDALGRMVEQNRSSTYSQVVHTPSGAKLATARAGALQKAFVPLPGGLIAVYNSSGLAYYRHSDWLGSSRFASTPGRALYYDGAYGPFGELYAQSGTTDASFTGMNQDTVANLYDFPAREYGTQGRWPSPDPADLAAVDPTDPRTWNRYAYVRNNPLAAVDPQGLVDIPPGLFEDGGGDGACVWDDGSNVASDDPDTGNMDACDALGGTWDTSLAGDDADEAPDPSLAATIADLQNLPDPFDPDTNKNLASNPSAPQAQPLGWCTALNHAGNTTVGLGAVVFLWGTLADAGVVTAPAGIISQASGGIGMAVGGIGIEVADAGMALGICH